MLDVDGYRNGPSIVVVTVGSCRTAAEITLDQGNVRHNSELLSLAK